MDYCLRKGPCITSIPLVKNVIQRAEIVSPQKFAGYVFVLLPGCPALRTLRVRRSLASRTGRETQHDTRVRTHCSSAPQQPSVTQLPYAGRVMPVAQCHIARSITGRTKAVSSSWLCVCVIIVRPGGPVLFIVYYYGETFPPPGRWPAGVGRPGRGRRENAFYSRFSVTLRAAVSHHTGTTTHNRSVNPEKTTSHRACAHAPRLRASFCVQCVRAPS